MFSNLIELSLGVLGWVSYAVFCVWGFLKIVSSRREHPCAPRTSWQKLGENWICSVLAANPCARRELLGRKLGILDSLSSRREACWRREPCFAEFFLNFKMT